VPPLNITARSAEPPPPVGFDTLVRIFNALAFAPLPQISEGTDRLPLRDKIERQRKALRGLIADGQAEEAGGLLRNLILMESQYRALVGQSSK